MLKEDINIQRKLRHKEAQEDFTPNVIIDILCMFDHDMYTNFNSTICDPCCGTGNILCYILNKRLQFCTSETDVLSAVQTIYGTDLIEDNIAECKQRIIYNIVEYSNKHDLLIDTSKIITILDYNIKSTDFFTWDYTNW